MNKELKDMSITEIESLCYQQLKLLQQTQTNIQILENELVKRQSQSQSQSQSQNVDDKKEGV